MTLWLIFALVVVAVVAALVRPLLGKQAATDPDAAAAGHLAVYKDQLAELERDREIGLLSPSDADAAEAEIHRHMLNAARTLKSQQEAQPQAAARTRIATAVIAVAMPAAAFGAYVFLGSPNLPDQPHADRQITDASGAGHNESQISDAIAQLAERLENDPDNLEGWYLLARSLAASNRNFEAVAAFRKAVALAPDDIAMKGDLAEVLIRESDGIVGSEAMQLLEDVRAATPEDPRARYYVALGWAQAGRARDAIAIWRGLEVDSPADAPWLEAVRDRISETAQQAGIPPISVEPQRVAQVSVPDAKPTVADAPPGPTAADIAAAQDMDSDSQQAMIQSMVERLADRLQSEPNDIDGWLRLARSYVVLGERDKVRGAILSAAAAPNITAAQRAQVEAMAAEFGIDLEAPGDTSSTATANEDDFVRDQVEGLAARLEKEGGSADKWAQLGRSFLVLKEPERAVKAYAQAVVQEPRNLTLLTGYAEALFAAPPPAPPLPSDTADFMTKLLELDPSNDLALWYAGLAAAQGGRDKDAASYWDKLLETLEPTSNGFAAVKQYRAGLKAAG